MYENHMSFLKEVCAIARDFSDTQKLLETVFGKHLTEEGIKYPDAD